VPGSHRAKLPDGHISHPEVDHHSFENDTGGRSQLIKGVCFGFVVPSPSPNKPREEVVFALAASALHEIVAPARPHLLALRQRLEVDVHAATCARLSTFVPLLPGFEAVDSMLD
jgi:hypothetical protein